MLTNSLGMKRRAFLKSSAVTATAMTTFGKVCRAKSAFVGDTPTTSDVLGPFYRPGAPIRTSLIPQGAQGDLLKVAGRIVSKDGSPLPNTLIECWQCDLNGDYDNTSDDYLYRASLKTGNDGAYKFKTLYPASYGVGDEMRPAHIHYRISHPEFQDLITQIYFHGDPHLEKDPASGTPGAAHRILKSARHEDGTQSVRFDVVMQRTLPLEPSVYSKISGLYELESGTAEFYREDDLLYLKRNGQIVEALAYKGNNTFSSVTNANRVEFEFLTDGRVKCHIVLGDFEQNKEWLEKYSGIKFMKYEADF